MGANRSGTIRKLREKRRNKHLKRLLAKAEKKVMVDTAAPEKK